MSPLSLANPPQESFWYKLRRMLHKLLRQSRGRQFLFVEIFLKLQSVCGVEIISKRFGFVGPDVGPSLQTSSYAIKTMMNQTAAAAAAAAVTAKAAA